MILCTSSSASLGVESREGAFVFFLAGIDYTGRKLPDGSRGPEGDTEWVNTGEFAVPTTDGQVTHSESVNIALVSTTIITIKPSMEGKFQRKHEVPTSNSSVRLVATSGVLG